MSQRVLVEVKPDEDLSAERTIEEGRRQIDRVDTQILDLLERRKVLSLRIQAARVRAGGTKVEHSRENLVVRRYRSRLGKAGTSLIMAILEMCRGKVDVVERGGKTG